MKGKFTPIIAQEGDDYVAWCQEIDIASQGDTIETARHNLKEALELFFKIASTKEINHRIKSNQFNNTY